MTDINLTEEDMLILQRCLNEGMEPPQELAKKLFPSLYASFDFKTLKDSKIPTIEYQGKRSEAAILNEASIFGGGSPLQLERCFDGGKIYKNATQLQLFKERYRDDDAGWRNLIVQGDNFQFLKTCYLNQDPIIKDRVKGKVKLVYIDPPFATKSDFNAKKGEDTYFKDSSLYVCRKESGQTQIITFKNLGQLFREKDISKALEEKIIRGDYGG